MKVAYVPAVALIPRNSLSFALLSDVATRDER